MHHTTAQEIKEAYHNGQNELSPIHNRYFHDAVIFEDTFTDRLRIQIPHLKKQFYVDRRYKDIQVPDTSTINWALDMRGFAIGIFVFCFMPVILIPIFITGFSLISILIAATVFISTWKIDRYLEEKKKVSLEKTLLKKIKVRDYEMERFLISQQLEKLK